MLLQIIKISTCAIIIKKFSVILAAIFIQELQKFGKLTIILNSRKINHFKFICYYNSINNFNLLIINQKYYISIIVIFEYFNFYYLI